LLQEWWFGRQVLKKFLQRFAQTVQIDVQCKSSPASAAEGISEKISEMHDKSCATIQSFADHGEARNLK
jgi:hypothetical protein